jgi:hypothetical protein
MSHPSPAAAVHSSDAELVASLAKLWPHREHESNSVKNPFCSLGLHRWRQLDLSELHPEKSGIASGARRSGSMGLPINLESGYLLLKAPTRTRCELNGLASLSKEGPPQGLNAGTFCALNVGG